MKKHLLICVALLLLFGFTFTAYSRKARKVRVEFTETAEREIITNNHWTNNCLIAIRRTGPVVAVKYQEEQTNVWWQIDGKQYGPFQSTEQVEFTPNGHVWWFIAYKHGSTDKFLVINGKQFDQPFSSASLTGLSNRIYSTSDGKNWWVEGIESDGQSFVVINGMTYGPNAFGVKHVRMSDGKEYVYFLVHEAQILYVSLVPLDE